MSTPSPTEINGRIRMLELQRDRAQDECVVLHGKLAVMDERIKELEASQAAPVKDEGKTE